MKRNLESYLFFIINILAILDLESYNQTIKFEFDSIEHEIIYNLN